jgi:ribonuclease HI
MNIENITVFTDASFCPETKAAGGAFWARGEKVKFSSSFPIPDATVSNDAEIAAVCRAIHEVAAHPELGLEMAKGRETRLVIVVDCEAAKFVFEGRRVKINAQTRALVREALQVIRDKGCWHKVNHVKSHSGTKTPRTWVNDWCDKEAYKHMDEMRKTRQR